jgi:ribosomal protein L11 methyltransferase
MIVAMNALDMKNKDVLDFGSGTGLLAIFASMKGAATIVAIDIEPPSYDNMIENFELNNISNATVYLGGKEQIPPDKKFDIILANITANVILECLEELAKALNKGGTILFSGFFESNLQDIEAECKTLELHYINHTVNGGWVVAAFEK